MFTKIGLAGVTVRCANASHIQGRQLLLHDHSKKHWFVYAEPGVTCLLGQPWLATRGCIGNAGDIVSVAAWHNMELVTYPGDGFWTARVYDSDGITAHDVATME